MVSGTEQLRISRPLGVTLKALENKREEVYEICSRKFLQGTFPYRIQNLSMERFSLLFHVPLKAIHKVVKEGIQEESLLGVQDLKSTLEDVRVRLLDNSLYQYGVSTAKLQRLLNYLEDRVYSSRASEPSLIRELNTALASAFKGIDSSAKVLTLLNEALVTTPETSNEPSHLSTVQILEILQDQPKSLGKTSTTGLPNPDMDAMIKEIENTPSLDPLKSGNSVSLIPLKPTQGEYTKVEELKESPIPEQLLINPI